MSGVDLVQWLSVQLDEDEEEARRGYLKAEPLPDYDGWNTSTTAGMPPAVVARVLREIDAKRRIIAEVVPEIDGMEARIDGEWGAGDPGERESMALLRLLALPYSGRPGYAEAIASAQ